jgi:hypothetical protein
MAVCVHCGASAMMRCVRAQRSDFHLRVICAHCAATYAATLSGILFCHPRTQRFWRDHPRMALLPDRAIEFDGQPAALTSFVSRNGAARLDFISDLQTFTIWRIDGAVANMND